MIHAFTITLTVGFDNMFAKDRLSQYRVNLIQNMTENKLNQFVPARNKFSIRKIPVLFASAASPSGFGALKNWGRHRHDLTIFKKCQCFIYQCYSPFLFLTFLIIFILCLIFLLFPHSPLFVLLLFAFFYTLFPYPSFTDDNFCSWFS